MSGIFLQGAKSRTGLQRAVTLATASILFVLSNCTDLVSGVWPKRPSKQADTVEAACSISPNEIQQGSTEMLAVKIQAQDSKHHPLSYFWSSNGGKITGTSDQAKVDTSGLGLGIYRVQGVARDADQNSAVCMAEFHVIPQPDLLSMTCSAQPAVVDQGKPAAIDAQAASSLGRPLHYRWFANGGKLSGDGAAVQLDTSGIRPGTYTITGRAEDDLGAASDCAAVVTVNIPPPPPVPAEPSNVAEIVFSRNGDLLESSGRTQLQRLVSRLQKSPLAKISIEAYAGPDENNPTQLAAGRAEVVKRYFLENGIAESQLRTTVGLGGKRGGLRNRTLDVIWLPEGLDY